MSVNPVAYSGLNRDALERTPRNNSVIMLVRPKRERHCCPSRRDFEFKPGLIPPPEIVERNKRKQQALLFTLGMPLVFVLGLLSPKLLKRLPKSIMTFPKKVLEFFRNFKIRGA
ncbi:MAG: hypothetical protein LBK53_02025 [Heliobacteriaceae bacterium]|jgi:hypothetical protein|nr:hypothetical protein [Heliobacteriaceae bacterium]